MPPPNVLFILVDQHRFDCLGANGHPFLRTPHLDRLAREGMSFTRAFCPIALCVPSRVSLLTGQWPVEHGAIANEGTEAGRTFREGLTVFPQVLAAQGYWLGHVGKWQPHPRRGPTEFGYHEHANIHGYRAWRQAAGLPPVPRQNKWFGETDPHITPEQSALAWGCDHLLRLLEARAGQAQPFYLEWNTEEPHLPNVVPEPYASMYPPASIPPWPSFGDRFHGKPYIQAQQLRTWGLDHWGWREWAPIVSRYLGELSLLDAQVGRLLAALDRLGLANNTLVVYTTDHGDMCGGHGMIDKHFIMYEDVMHVPLLARWPGRIAAGRRCDAFVCHATDLAATFCAVAGSAPPATMRGISLLPLFDGAASNGREDIFASYHGNQFGLYSQRMLREARWKYIWNATAEDELYDLETDPAELQNLALSPRGAAELPRLRRRLVAWLEATHDPLLNGWTRDQLLLGRTW